MEYELNALEDAIGFLHPEKLIHKINGQKLMAKCQQIFHDENRRLKRQFYQMYFALGDENKIW